MILLTAVGLSNGTLLIDRNEVDEKKIEAAIEAVTNTVIMSQVKANKTVQTMLCETVIYTVCKRVGLDVRTYMLGKDFEDVAVDKRQLKSMLNIANGYVNQVLSIIMP